MFCFSKIKRNKEKKSRKNSGVNTSDNKSLLGTSQTDSNEKTTELNPIFIQSLLKESKLKVKFFFTIFYDSYCLTLSKLLKKD